MTKSPQRYAILRFLCSGEVLRDARPHIDGTLAQGWGVEADTKGLGQALRLP